MHFSELLHLLDVNDIQVIKTVLMKTLTFTLSMILFITLSSFGQDQYNPPSSITKAIIYEKGAMVTRTIDTKAISKNGIITIDSLPQRIQSKSIQVQSGNGFKIVSVKFNTELEYDENESELDSINNVVGMYQDSIIYNNTLLKSIRHEISVIQENDEFKTEKEGVNIDQLSKATDLYKNRLRELFLEEMNLIKMNTQLNSKINTCKHGLMSANKPAYRNHQAQIKVEKTSKMDNSMTISYFTPDATWYTFYDLRVAVDDRNNYLDHKAYVSQTTGEDWKDVQLTLSNRNPNKRISPPSITPYNLKNIRHRGYQNNVRVSDDNIDRDYITGIITDEYGEPLIGASVLIGGTMNGTITNIDGTFSIQNLNRNNKLVISYTGYQTLEIDIRGLEYVSAYLTEGQLLDEIVVTGSESYRKSSRISISKDRLKKETVRKSISIKEQQSLNVSSFILQDPYTIPTDGKEYDVLLKSNDIEFEYEYLAYPSIEPTAYLNVGIPDWKKYNLFSGNVNLFLGGQYTGVSHIDIGERTDTLWFSLGEDIGVNVEREPVEEYNKKSFLKNKVIELHTFDIFIKNNKNRAIDIDVIDQLPISTDDDIKVKILEITEANHEEKTGYLNWKEKLAPGAAKTYRVSYEIKYGKNVDIVSK